jgi:hypothetical protein
MSWRELVVAAEAVRATALAYDATLEGQPLAGIGWATVEAERAQRELDASLGPEENDWIASWTPIARDPALGARAWLRSVSKPAAYSNGDSPGMPADPADPRPALVLLEPDTEGRLAASLAKFGEGVAVIYLGEGPAGAGRLVRGGGMWGPHVVLVDIAASAASAAGGASGASGSSEGTA